MTLTYHYKPIKRKDGIVKSPHIPITLKGSNSFLDTTALLDSGADISAMPLEVAEVLNLDLSGKKDTIGGVGGKANSIDSYVKICIIKGHEKYEFNIPVKVILSKTDFGVILGRNGFFDKFIITFDQRNEKIMLKRKF